MFFLSVEKASAARISGGSSGNISHYSLVTGTTTTSYQQNIDIDRFLLSWDTSRTEVRYAGYVASYHTPRFMDPNITYTFGSSFVFKSGSASGSQIGSINEFAWSGGHKYAYFLPGSPNRSVSNGKAVSFNTAPNQSVYLTTTIRIGCSKNTAALNCGTKTLSEKM